MASDVSPPPVPDGLLDGDEHVADEIVLRGEAADPGGYPVGTFRKFGSGLAALIVCIVAAYLVPGLEWARPWTSEDPVPFWNLIGRELLGEGAEVEAAEAEAEQAEALAVRLEQERPEREVLPSRTIIDAPAPPDGHLPAYVAHPDDAEAVVQPLEMPSADALDPFFAQLARTDAGYAGEVTRITQWGDSVVAADHVTSAIRFEMQRRFGDAGHGFHLLARPNPSYRHRGVRFSGGEEFRICYIINACRDDGRYGLGGTTVWSAGGAQSRFRTETELPYGRSWSRFELWYVAHPKGGKIKVTVDDADAIVIDSRAEVQTDAWELVTFPDGAHDIRVRAVGGEGVARMYGVVLERDGPGVVWDGMEQLGAFTRRMLNFDPDHLRAQIEHRDPDLLVFMFGGNDLSMVERKHRGLERDVTEMLRRFRAGDTPRACLVVSPVDHGVRRGPQIVSIDTMEPVVALLRRVALAEGCAFFDTYQAMGGPGSAGRWRRRDHPLMSADLSHLNAAGQRVVGHHLYLALMREYVAYRDRTDAE